jgi:hypothetical protein
MRSVFVRSLATRRAHLALSRSVADAVTALQAADFDLILVETAGIGQSDSEIVDLVDHSVYVMTPEFGAPSQLEKIDMLDLADLIVLNKSDRQGAADALRDVRKQWRRNRSGFDVPDPAVPVFATIARQWNDPGVDRLYAALRARLDGEAWRGEGRRSRPWSRRFRSRARAISPRSPRRCGAGTRRRAVPPRPPAGARRSSGPFPRSTRRCPRRHPTTLPRCARCGSDATRPGARSTRPCARRSRAGPPSRSAIAPMGRSTSCAGAASASRTTARRSPEPACRRWRCRATPTGEAWCASCAARTCRAASPSPPACFRSSDRARTRPACSRARARRSGPTAGSTCSARDSRRRASPPPSTASRSTAAIRPSASTSGARSATPASRSAPWRMR